MKLVVPEDGSAEAIDAWSGAERIVSSLLLYPEARSALARAARSRRLTGAEAATARALAERLWRDVDRIELTEELVLRAGQLADAHALRGYDAVHLASAASIADDELVLVAGDGALLEAADELALATARLS